MEISFNMILESVDVDKKEHVADLTEEEIEELKNELFTNLESYRFAEFLEFN